MSDRYAAISAHRGLFPVRLMCRLLEVSTSGFYDAMARRASGSRSARMTSDERVRVHIHVRAAHRKSRGCYGAPRVHAALRGEGLATSRKRVARLMREEGLVGRRRRKFVRTTDSRHTGPVAENLLARRFAPAEHPVPDRVWCGDLTYIPTREGWLYLAVLLDLVAVGTVADLVPLDVSNRALVTAGLRRLRAGRGAPGLQALVEVAGRDPRALSAADIGYAVAPRLNAAGRLEDMALGIECLLCDDPARARELARTLDAINSERRTVQAAMVNEAEAAVAACVPDGAGAAQVAWCLFDAQWHPGVIGLVASRLKERLHRPVVAFAPAGPEGDVLRGSARSIPGFHMRDALAAVDVAEPGLIERFGGHAMAAGLTLRADSLRRFEDAFRRHAAAVLDDSLLHSVVDSDGELEPAEFDRFHAEALRDGGPWGQAFPEPVFDGEFELLDFRQVGERHLRMRLRAAGRSGPLKAIHFGGWREQPPPARVRLAFRLACDDWRDARDIQLVVDHLEPA